MNIEVILFEEVGKNKLTSTVRIEEIYMTNEQVSEYSLELLKKMLDEEAKEQNEKE